MRTFIFINREDSEKSELISANNFTDACEQLLKLVGNREFDNYVLQGEQG